MKQQDNKNKALKLINHQLQITSSLPTGSEEDAIIQLSEYLNDLIQQDFNKLLSLLYRIDVSEKKVRAALADNSSQQSAGSIIAELLIEREIQKMKWRDKYRSK